MRRAELKGSEYSYSYLTSLQARDAAGNTSQTALNVDLIAPTPVPSGNFLQDLLQPLFQPPAPRPTRTPTSTPTATPTRTPTPSRAVVLIPISGPPPAAPNPVSDEMATNILWGAAAVAATTAALTYAAGQRQKQSSLQPNTNFATAIANIQNGLMSGISTIASKIGAVLHLTQSNTKNDLLVTPINSVTPKSGQPITSYPSPLVWPAEVHGDVYEMSYEIALQEARQSRSFTAEEAEEFARYIATEVQRGDLAADMSVIDENGQVLSPLDKQYWPKYIREFIRYLLFNPLVPPSPLWLAPHWHTPEGAIHWMNLANDPFNFGIALHMYQDSYSHYTRAGEPKLPIQIWWDHYKNFLAVKLNFLDETASYDFYNPKSDEINEMNRNSEQLIREFAERQIHQSIPTVSRSIYESSFPLQFSIARKISSVGNASISFIKSAANSISETIRGVEKSVVTKLIPSVTRLFQFNSPQLTSKPTSPSQSTPTPAPKPSSTPTPTPSLSPTSTSTPNPPSAPIKIISLKTNLVTNKTPSPINSAIKVVASSIKTTAQKITSAANSVVKYFSNRFK